MSYRHVDSAAFTELRSEKQDPNAILSAELGAAFDEYRRLWDAAARMEFVPDYPIHIDFELNYTCNIRCPMCPHGMPEFKGLAQYDNLVMRTEIFKDIIREGCPLGLRSVRLNLLGEPLLRKDLVDLAAYARAHGVVDVMMNTNGVLLTAETSERLIDAGLTRLMVSLDAMSKNVHERVRVGSDFDLVIGNIFQFLEIRAKKRRRLPLFRVSFVKLKWNQHEIDAFVRYWEKYADYLSIQGCIDYTTLLSRESEDDYFLSDRSPDGLRCPQPFQRVAVYVNGDVAPCCSGAEFFRSHAIGNVRRQSLAELWQSRVVKDLRDLHDRGDWRRSDICVKCVTSR